MNNVIINTISLFLIYSCTSSKVIPTQKGIEKEYKVHTIAFYNVENLFDLEDDPNTVFHDITPRVEKFYTKEVYTLKQNNLAKVISDIGKDMTGTTPTVVGLVEIENYNVVNDLANQDALLDSDYSIIHYDSPDLRGIDVALIYKKSEFIPTNSVSHRLDIVDIKNTTRKLHTRDQLIVSGFLENELIYFIVHHWPSKRDGEAKSLHKRMKAAELNRKIIDSILNIDAKAKIINMGDFNDDPFSPSIKEGIVTSGSRIHMKATDMYNPMESMHNQGMGTIARRDSWHLFDQIMVSHELVKRDFRSLRFYQAGIFNKSYLATPHGRFKGYPYRSYSNEGWTGGYSDHFPVFIYLIKEK